MAEAPQRYVSPPVSPPVSPHAERHHSRLAALERRGSLSLLALSLAVLAVAAVLAVVHLRGEDGAQQRERDRAAALAAGRAFGTALTTYDYRTLDAGFAAVGRRSTGAFAQEYASTTDQLRSAISASRASSRSTVRGAGLQDLTGTRARVVVLVDQTITNRRTGASRVERNRLVLTLDEVDGRWLAAAVTPV